MSTSTSSSYIFPSSAGASSPSAPGPYDDPASDHDEIDSLPSSIDSSDMESNDGYRSDAQKEWEESLQQLELLLTMVVVPYMGKFFGRKFAYYSWAKYMEWMYEGVEVRITNRAAFNAVGAVEAAATL